MLTIENNLQTMVVGSEDGKYTYEVKRSWGEVRIVNLYSTVFLYKPSVKELKSDVENVTYIRKIFESEEAREYDIVIAWGSSLAAHTETIRAKTEILDMLKEKSLEKQVMHIITDSLDTNGQTGTHPLYLGLRHAKESWQLYPYPLDRVLKELKNSSKKNITDKNVEEQATRADMTDTEASGNREEKEVLDKPKGEESKPRKGRKKDVLQNKESAGC